MKGFKILFYILIILSLSTSSCSDIDKEEQALAADRMKDFVIKISQYAKQQNPNFIIIPQNGEELCFKNENQKKGLEISYLNSIKFNALTIRIFIKFKSLT